MAYRPQKVQKVMVQPIVSYPYVYTCPTYQRANFVLINAHVSRYR